MTTNIDIDVTVTNPKKKKKGVYGGDFTYTQTTAGTQYVDDKGKIDISKLSDDVQLNFVWCTSSLNIDGEDCAVMYGTPLNANIWIKEGKDSTPDWGDAPPVSGNGEFTAPPTNASNSLLVHDKNDDGKKYSYALHAYLAYGEDGSMIIDDPRVLNRSLD